MKFKETSPPRTFTVGTSNTITIEDCGNIELAVNQQVTFFTPSGSQFDVTRKNFGYYATPSLNNRLPANGLRPALIRNNQDRYYIVLVEPHLKPEFDNYICEEKETIVAWLDDEKLLRLIEKTIRPD